mmetsp:Transcript_10692/g.27026  ORF Transcript_10692/g.27026 Transcript_10692/m.27026 type:complete len:368 (+) Transcript_10692:84-1187(+)
MSVPCCSLVSSTRRSSDHTTCRVEEVQRGCTVADHDTLQAQTLQQLGLHLWAGASDLLQCVGADGVHGVLELLRLDLGQLLVLGDVELVEQTLVLDLGELTLLLQLQLDLGADPRGVRTQLSLLHRRTTLDGGDRSLGLGLSAGLTCGLDVCALHLQPNQFLAALLDAHLVGDALALKLTLRLLLLLLGGVLGSGLLCGGGDLDSKLHTLLQRVTSALVDGLHSLDIDVGDDQTVGRELEGSTDAALLVHAKHGLTNDASRLLVEGVERARSHGTTHTRRNRLAHVTAKVRHREERNIFAALLHLKMPVVGELQLKTGMITRLNIDVIRTELRAKTKLQTLDHVRAFRLVTTEREHREFLIWTEHDQ